MAKDLFIAEKPSVAREFANTLGVSGNAGRGYLESDAHVVTWCVGHLVTMSYPEVYDPALKKWSLETLPFLPENFLYELIPEVKKQFDIVKGLLNRPDIATIYVCTDSGREGEYIYRLVDQMAEVPGEKDKRRVWIDSQTEEEIRRGIAEAKPLSAYDNLAASAYLRAKEDYLMGINFSRVLSLKYSYAIMNYRKGARYAAIAVGRVMTCVLGMVVRREREIRSFVKTPFYRINGRFSFQEKAFHGEFRAVKGSKYFESPLLYKENGFRERKTAEELCSLLGFSFEREKDHFYLSPGPDSGKEADSTISADSRTPVSSSATVDSDASMSSSTSADSSSTKSGSMAAESREAVVETLEKKTEKKNPPLLFNLAELQNVCSKLFKISPDETLKIAQELYEKKLVTYPRTDARVLSTAVSKEIHKNLNGLRSFAPVREIAEKILSEDAYRKIAKTRYCDDKKITDHYAIIPTGQGFGALRSISALAGKVYEVIVRRFLCIFYPPAKYQRINLVAACDSKQTPNSTSDPSSERFFAGFKMLADPGFLAIRDPSFLKGRSGNSGSTDTSESPNKDEEEDNSLDMELLQAMSTLKKGSKVALELLEIKEGETTPPKRYNSGSLILAMENAGQLIEDEELRSQIKGSGIGTSATRAEILSKLVGKKYLKLNKKTQILTPELLGEMIYDVVDSSIRSLLNPELTASWEKGLTYMAEGKITEDEYMQKLESYITKWVDGVKGLRNQSELRKKFDAAAAYYKTGKN